MWYVGQYALHGASGNETAKQTAKICQTEIGLIKKKLVLHCQIS